MTRLRELVWVLTCAVVYGVAGPAAVRADDPAPLPAIQAVEIGAQGQFIVNGEPFLPIMSWLQHPNNKWNSFAHLRSLGFNTFMGNQVTPLEQAEAAEAAGGYCVVQSSSAAQVAAAAGHDYILGWHLSDEPDMPQDSGAGWEPKVPPAEVVSQYQWLQDQGVGRPVFTTYTSHFMAEFRSRYSAARQAELYPQYVAGADVVGYDLYPIYGYGCPAWLNRTASGVAQLVQLAEGRPVYVWIETSKGSQWITYEQQPDVLPVHTRYQVWGALIQGATAVGYFTHAWQPTFDEFAPTPEMETELHRLNSQLTQLAPALLASPSETPVSITMVDLLGGIPLTSHFKATDYDGRLWIFAQNTDLGPDAAQLGQFDPITPRAALATVYVEGLTAGTEVIRLGDDQHTVLFAGDGYFQDTFEALGERVYSIAVVPEPATMSLLALGAAALLARRRRRA
ncbi:MAG: PEP-CTERM sorting domain-containing protein [Phycisphaerae bacterium]|nr:PEP-CTERM sorting domain-containing protein [Phycisphaerae bacterium]